MEATIFTGLIYDHLLPMKFPSQGSPLGRFVQETAIGANRTSRFTTTPGQLAEHQDLCSESSRFD